MTHPMKPAPTCETRHLLDRAKELIREKLLAHEDRSVRVMAEMVDLTDDHPGVQKIAAELATRLSHPTGSDQ